MTAGHIPPEWLAAARSNETSATVEDQLRDILNVRTVEIDATGSVWIVDPAEGHWLTQDRIDEILQQIDAGVRPLATHADAMTNSYRVDAFAASGQRLASETIEADASDTALHQMAELYPEADRFAAIEIEMP